MIKGETPKDTHTQREREREIYNETDVKKY